MAGPKKSVAELTLESRLMGPREDVVLLDWVRMRGRLVVVMRCRGRGEPSEEDVVEELDVRRIRRMFRVGNWTVEGLAALKGGEVCALAYVKQIQQASS